MFDIIPFRRNNSLARKGDEFQNLFDNFFNNNFFNNANLALGSDFTVDLKEDEKNYIIEADLPGISKENIEISYNNNYLTISAKREDSLEDRGENYVRREKKYGQYKRSFYIDNTVEYKIEASFKDGVLKIILPKSENEPITKKNRYSLNSKGRFS